MSNGSSVLDESASVLFAYAAPEIERSKVLFEELCRRFDGNDMQGKYDQMLLFEKLSEGSFDDMIKRAIERRHHGTAQVAAGQYGAQCTVAAGKVGIEGKRRCTTSS